MDNLFATAFIWEFLLTFFLMLVIMAVATDYRATGQAAGLAIGGTIWFEAMFAGPLCGASMNPRAALDPLWPLVIGPIFPLTYSVPFSAQLQARFFTNSSAATPNPAPMPKVVVKNATTDEHR